MDRVLLLLTVLVTVVTPASTDVVELTGGVSIEGDIIEQTDALVRVMVKGSGKEVAWPTGQVVAVTVDGERREVAASAPAPVPPGAPPDAPPGTPELTPLEADALIQEQGRKQPDWWGSVQVIYPATMDLDWNEPSKPRNNQKSVDPFIWDIINPNPRRWREGVKFVHQLLVRNQRDPVATQKAMGMLSRMYHSLLQDYPRAAFWIRQIGDRRRLYYGEQVSLADCYWRMGCRVMAVDTVRNMRVDHGGGQLVQLWADMGDLQQALSIAEASLRGRNPDRIHLAAGNACRQYGLYTQALAFYRQALAVARHIGDRDLSVKRAQANIEAIVLFETLDISRAPDGTYEDQSMGFQGQIRVAVTMRDGRIGSVEIRQHNEKQFYNAFTETIDQIVGKQGVRGIDATTGATVTSSAVMNATAKALSAAMQ